MDIQTPEFVRDGLRKLGGRSVLFQGQDQGWNKVNGSRQEREARRAGAGESGFLFVEQMGFGAEEMEKRIVIMTGRILGEKEKEEVIGCEEERKDSFQRNG